MKTQSNYNQETVFPFQKDTVFEAVCNAVSSVEGLKIDATDKLNGRIMVKAGISLWSWGENIPIQLSTLPDAKTKVQIRSLPKTGIMLGESFDMGKNRKNMEQILLATSKILLANNPQS